MRMSPPDGLPRSIVAFQARGEILRHSFEDA